MTTRSSLSTHDLRLDGNGEVYAMVEDVKVVFFVHPDGEVGSARLTEGLRFPTGFPLGLGAAMNDWAREHTAAIRAASLRKQAS
jgi:hypothetical protein